MREREKTQRRKTVERQRTKQVEAGAGCQATSDVGAATSAAEVVCRPTHVLAKIFLAQPLHRQDVLVAGQHCRDVIVVRPQYVAVP